MPPLLPGQRPPRMGAQEFELAKQMDEAVVEIMEDPKAAEYDIMIRDNSSESYRDPHDGTLLVKRAPHEVRPPADTGVKYTIDSEGALSLSLNNASPRHERERSSFKLKTDHALCQACCDVFNYYCLYNEARVEHHKLPEEDRPPLSLSNNVVHHYNIFSLLAFAVIDKCWLCQTLLKSIKRRFGDALGMHNYEDFRTQVCWKRKLNLKEKDILYFVVQDPTAPVDTWNPSHFYRMEAWPVDILPRHYDPVTVDESNELPEMSEISLMDQLNTKSPSSQRLAKSWLSQCKADINGRHHECNRRDTKYIPTRLLDIRHAQMTSQLRLVCFQLTPEAFAENREWMTLSHCWGRWGAEENPILVNGNLQERREIGLKVSELPQTFQDAIEVAVSWLWIDCLCIIQDSKEDWLREAGMMSEIYQNAQINISADTGPDSRAGCFTERREDEITPLEIGCPAISQSWEVLPNARFLFEWMSQATSLSRAWIHRERQLARRVLHFTDTELVWECCGIKGAAFASEMLPMGAPFETGLFNRDHKYQIGRLQQGLLKGDEETYATWNDVCEKLSEKHLTQPSDMPMVLSGLAKDFASNLPEDKYIAGLWSSTLPHSLLWKTRAYKDPNLEYIAPSWSWLSTGCSVTLANRGCIAAKIPIATILNQDTKLRFDDPYGSIESSTLEVEGILRRIQMSFDEELQHEMDFDVTVFENYGDEDSEYEEWRDIGNSWDDYLGHMCSLELDEELEEPVLDCYCLIVTIEQWFDRTSSRDLACLLLQPVDDDMKVFRRIGTIVFKHTFALKMRYWMANDLEDDLWDKLERIISNTQHMLRSDRRREEEDVDGAQDAGDADDKSDRSSETKDVGEVQDAKSPDDKSDRSRGTNDADKSQNFESSEVITKDAVLKSRKQPLGLDALYQFDDIIYTTYKDMLGFKKLELETLIII